MAIRSQNQVPASLEPIGQIQLGGRPIPATVAPVWYQFLQSLSSIVNNIVGGVLGFTLNNAITATGTTQADAKPLATEWTVVTVVPLNSGVMLNSFGPGVPNTVINAGAHPLKVYPPVGAQIDAAGVNVPYALAANKVQVFNQTASAQFYSTQLG